MKRSIAIAIFANFFVVAFLAFPATSRLQENKKFLRRANPIANNYLVVLDDSVVGEKGAFSIAPQVAADLASIYKAGSNTFTSMHLMDSQSRCQRMTLRL